LFVAVPSRRFHFPLVNVEEVPPMPKKPVKMPVILSPEGDPAFLELRSPARSQDWPPAALSGSTHFQQFTARRGIEVAGYLCWSWP
jgi:hypothetical protein